MASLDESSREEMPPWCPGFPLHECRHGCSRHHNLGGTCRKLLNCLLIRRGHFSRYCWIASPTYHPWMQPCQRDLMWNYGETVFCLTNGSISILMLKIIDFIDFKINQLYQWFSYGDATTPEKTVSAHWSMTQHTPITSSFESIDHLPVTPICQTFKGHASLFSFLSPKPWHLCKMYKHLNHSTTFLNSSWFFRYQIPGSGCVLTSTVCGLSTDVRHLSGIKDEVFLTLTVFALQFLKDMMMNRPSCYSDLCWRSCWTVMLLYYFCSKWTQHAARWSSTPVPPVCCRPSTLHDRQRPQDPRRGEPGQPARI